MENVLVNEVIAELEKLKELSVEAELSDVGNSVGYVIARHFDSDWGDLDDFMAGLGHGISLTEGTHG